MNTQSIAAVRTAGFGSEHRGEIRPSRAPKLWKDTMFWTNETKEEKTSGVYVFIRSGDLIINETFNFYLNSQVVQVEPQYVSSHTDGSLSLVVLS